MGILIAENFGGSPRFVVDNVPGRLRVTPSDDETAYSHSCAWGFSRPPCALYPSGEVNMSKETQPITKADLDALKQAVGKVTKKAATAKTGVGSIATYTR
jgi:hypothetical protein